MTARIKRWLGVANRDSKGNVPFYYGTCIKMTRWGEVTRDGRQPVGPVKMQWIELRPGSGLMGFGGQPTKLLHLTDAGLVMGLREGDRVRVHYRWDEKNLSGFWVGERYDWGTNR